MAKIAAGSMIESLKGISNNRNILKWVLEANILNNFKDEVFSECENTKETHAEIPDFPWAS